MLNIDEEKLKQLDMELLKGDLEELAKVERNSFFEPFDHKDYADEEVGDPLGCSYLTTCGRIMLGQSKYYK